MDKIRKFVSWDIPALETLTASEVYKVYEKMTKGERLTREEKNFVTRNVNQNAHFRDSIPLQGWRFNFSRILKTYLVKQYDHWQEYQAVDITSLRAILYGRVAKIIQIPA